MKMTIGFSQFVDAFHNMGRETQFTYAGKRALFDYLEELSEDTGDEIELDVIALCCEYSEHASALDAYNDYNGGKSCTTGEVDPCDCQDCKDEDDKEDHEEEREASALKWLQDRTSVIEFTGGIIIAQF